MVSILTPSFFHKVERDQNQRLLRHFVPRNDEKESPSQRRKGKNLAMTRRKGFAAARREGPCEDMKKRALQRQQEAEFATPPGGRPYEDDKEWTSQYLQGGDRARRRPRTPWKGKKQKPTIHPTRHCERSEAISGIHPARHCGRGEAVSRIPRPSLRAKRSNPRDTHPRHCERSEAISRIHPARHCGRSDIFEATTMALRLRSNFSVDRSSFI